MTATGAGKSTWHGQYQLCRVFLASSERGIVSRSGELEKAKEIPKNGSGCDSDSSSHRPAVVAVWRGRNCIQHGERKYLIKTAVRESESDQNLSVSTLAHWL